MLAIGTRKGRLHPVRDNQNARVRTERYQQTGDNALDLGPASKSPRPADSDDRSLATG